jgi:hypothetical protein
MLLAFDRALGSGRRYDADGRLVAKVPLSRVGVFEYLGSTIPGFRALGLAADKVYRVYRSARELAKAVPSFGAGLALLSDHVALGETPSPDQIVGVIGEDAAFDGDQLSATVTVFSKSAIDGIVSGEKAQLSAGYRYSVPPRIEAGTFDGMPYDCVMRDLVADHVALVDAGKCGRSCSL